MTSSKFSHLNVIATNETVNDHSFSTIIRNHKNKFPVGKRTLYNYVEKEDLDIINLVLPKKVRYKKK